MISSSTPGALNIECWGYWEDDVSALFTRASQAALEKVEAGVELSLDATLLKPQSGGGQDALRVFFAAVAAKSPARASVRVSNVLTQMQLTRLAAQAGLSSVRFSNLTSGAQPGRAK